MRVALEREHDAGAFPLIPALSKSQRTGVSNTAAVCMMGNLSLGASTSSRQERVTAEGRMDSCGRDETKHEGQTYTRNRKVSGGNGVGGGIFGARMDVNDGSTYRRSGCISRGSAASGNHDGIVPGEPFAGFADHGRYDGGRRALPTGMLKDSDNNECSGGDRTAISTRTGTDALRRLEEDEPDASGDGGKVVEVWKTHGARRSPSYISRR